MDSIIRAVYVVHLDGIPLVSLDFTDSSVEKLSFFEELFGGLSTAINSLIRELGHKELRSISVGDGLLVYSSRDPVLFVVHATHPRYEQFAKILMKQIEYQFFKEYADEINREDTYVHGEKYDGFKSNILDMYQHLNMIYKDYPQLLQFLPSFVPLYQLYMVLNLGLDIVKKFPDDTIKLVRDLNNYFDDDTELESVVAQTLGKYSGYEIAKERFPEKVVVDQEDILRILNEISVTKLDKKHEVYDIILCPICRGKTSDRPICNFLGGFIEGALGNPSITVNETACRAIGHKSCRFKLNRPLP